ncbi:MAG: Rpn family recombination-promoting nuclease/putative transposase [Gemmatimonadetes bacterium]|nr:Rpn family recombination-promoting nuclease/putative transposase [Gemmatimonadota bacterium]
MHDAFLKSVFADRRMAEILIRHHAPEWASGIDFSTLREESTGLVSKRPLDGTDGRGRPVPALPSGSLPPDPMERGYGR